MRSNMKPHVNARRGNYYFGHMVEPCWRIYLTRPIFSNNPYICLILIITGATKSQILYILLMDFVSVTTSIKIETENIITVSHLSRWVKNILVFFLLFFRFFVFEEVNEGSGLLLIFIVRESLATEEKDFLSDLNDVIFVIEDDF